MFSDLFRNLQKELDLQNPSTGDAEFPSVSPRDRAAAVLQRAEQAVHRAIPSPGDAPDRQEAEALAQRYLEAGWREWKLQHWGSSRLFRELALEWAARAAGGDRMVFWRSQPSERGGTGKP